jgi:hypothetical protein
MMDFSPVLDLALPVAIVIPCGRSIDKITSAADTLQAPLGAMGE